MGSFAVFNLHAHPSFSLIIPCKTAVRSAEPRIGHYHHSISFLNTVEVRDRVHNQKKWMESIFCDEFSHVALHAHASLASVSFYITSI